MTVTLVDVAKVQREPMAKAILLDLLRQCPVLNLIPIEPVKSLEVKDTRWQSLPSVSTRAIGGVYSESTGTLEQLKDTLHIYGGEFTVDRILEMVDTQESPMVTQGKMKTAALAARINYDFFYGSHLVDPLGFEGLAVRVANNPARCTINLETGGDTLKVLNSTATMQTFLDALHQALRVLGVPFSGSVSNVNVALFANETTLLGVGQILRRVGLAKTTEDIYDRVWETFGPAKLIDAGLQGDQSTEIISSSEAAGDGGTDSTSIYAVRFGGRPVQDASGQIKQMDDDGVRMIQLQGTSFAPYDPLAGGEGGVGANPGKLRRIDTPIGLRQAGKYSVVRIKGFKMAAS